MIRRTITAHISPYVGGLAPETHKFVAELNEEAARHKINVRFIATANRILAYGNLERAAGSSTIGGWVLRRAIASGFFAHRPQPGWETAAIEGEELLLRRGNSQHRKELRQQEKNRPPKKDYKYQRQHIALSDAKRCIRLQCDPERRPSDNIRLDKLIEIAGETLYRLICAMSLVERDREEIYPADFSTAFIPLPQQTNWQADKLERWRRRGWLLCGVSHAALHGHDSLGLRDFSEPARLLFKYGRYEFVTRQKAASPSRNILTITCELVDLPAIETRLTLYLWGQLTPPEKQQTLKRIGRLYKNSCWWAKKGPRRLFDKAEASSWKKAQVWKPGQLSVQFDPEDERLIAIRETHQIVRSGGQVVHLGSPAKRHATLKATRAAYNERYESYLNSAGLGKTLQLRGTLNIPRETIEVRNNMITNLEHDFARDESEVS